MTTGSADFLGYQHDCSEGVYTQMMTDTISNKNVEIASLIQERYSMK